MGLFKRNQQEPPEDESPAEGRSPGADRQALARQWREQGMQMQAQARQLQEQAMQQMAAFRQASQSRSTAEAGSGTWVRQVLAILAPPEPGFVKRCTCVVCATERLAEPGRRVSADGQQPVSQAGLAEMPHSFQALAYCDGYRHGLRLTREPSKFLDKLMGLSVLDVKAHNLPFYLRMLPW